MNKVIRNEMIDMFRSGVPTITIANKFDVCECEVVNVLENYGFWR